MRITNAAASITEFGRNEGTGRGAAPAAIRGRSRSFESDTSFELKVRTDEGDTVTLRFSRSVDRESIRVRNGDARLSAQRSSVSEEASVAIEGDLSEEELSDIRELLEGLQSGSVDPEELDSLAGFSLQYQQSTRTEQARIKLYA